MKYKTIKITPELIASMCTQGNRIDCTVVEGVPDGCVVVGCGTEEVADGLYVIKITVEHESFPDVEDVPVEDVPEAKITFSEYRKQ
jgi:hypothetical protein